MVWTLGFTMLCPPMSMTPSRSWLTRPLLLREKGKFLRLIVRGRWLFRVSLLVVTLAPASTNLGKLCAREVSINSSNNSETSTRDLVSTSSRCQHSSSNARWFRPSSRTAQLKGLAILVLVLNVIRWGILPIGARWSSKTNQQLRMGTKIVMVDNLSSKLDRITVRARLNISLWNQLNKPQMF